MLILIYLSVIFCGTNGALFYDSYTGTPITREDIKRHDKANNTFWCVTEMEPCTMHEGRRIDGSCNNLRNPTRGTSHTPFVRVLPPAFGENYDPPKSKSGKDLPLARLIRTSLISMGKVPSKVFTMLAAHFAVYMVSDVVSSHDTIKYLLWKPYCCSEKGKTDRDCVSNKIPDTDPVHRFSSHRCLNLTRPESFQSVGCVPNNTPPDRIASATPLLDLSRLYGVEENVLNEKGRLFKGGLLRYEVEDGKIWPPSYKKDGVCLLNQLPKETKCFQTPDISANSLVGIILESVWFWRYHNFIATQLAKVNPCWDDNKLFETARDINIAVALQIYYYELLPPFLGYDNMVRDGVINPHIGFRDDYNENILPQTSLEYPFVLRWMHNIQDGALKLFDKDGYYLKQVPIVNLTLRTGFFGVDNNIDHATQGSFRQASAKTDYVADPDMTDNVLGPLQAVSDVITSGIAKNRYFGFQPYVKYLEYCFHKKVHTFTDLREVIDDERIEILSNLYESVEDIDLLVGIWAEKYVNDGHVPPTLYCLVIDQLKRNIFSDRHWFERPNRPNAFSFYQLVQIKTITKARLLCDVGDSVTQIQPHAFLRISKKNPLVSCYNIPQMDFWAWKDKSCELCA